MIASLFPIDDGLLLAGTVAVASQLLASPFRTTQVDRTLPPVLVELRDLSDVHTAQGQFAVTVDVEQDVSWVPS